MFWDVHTGILKWVAGKDIEPSFGSSGNSAHNVRVVNKQWLALPCGDSHCDMHYGWVLS